MKTNPAVEQNKIIEWSESPWNQSGRWGKGLQWKGPMSQKEIRMTAQIQKKSQSIEKKQKAVDTRVYTVILD